MALRVHYLRQCLVCSNMHEMDNVNSLLHCRCNGWKQNITLLNSFLSSACFSTKSILLHFFVFLSKKGLDNRTAQAIEIPSSQNSLAAKAARRGGRRRS